MKGARLLIREDTNPGGDTQTQPEKYSGPCLLLPGRNPNAFGFVFKLHTYSKCVVSLRNDDAQVGRLRDTQTQADSQPDYRLLIWR